MIGDTVVVRRAGDVIPEVVRYLPEQAPRGRADPSSCPPRARCAARRSCAKRTRPCTSARAGCSSAARNAPSGSCISPAGARWTSKAWARRLIEQLVEDGSHRHARGSVRAGGRRAGRARAHGREVGEERRRRDRRRASETTLPRLLFGLGIPQVGESTARALAEQFGKLERLHEGERGADRGDAGRRSGRVGGSREVFRGPMARARSSRACARRV